MTASARKPYCSDCHRRDCVCGPLLGDTPGRYCKTCVDNEGFWARPCTGCGLQKQGVPPSLYRGLALPARRDEDSP